ncbi:DUF397 domain-containing protein [Rhizomonospora bruguierae]|uniref:DUF397 domain-containing protein n=1 Tax=Rhizomonospora bruguierae TaxID=1581705 RepID=UPI001BCB4609|nr:DUF397 domain-containing protein [Micromonospora sp. NBRC 107566]
MALPDSTAARWRKSTRCESSNCLELADLGAHAGLRNSTRPEVQLTFEAPAWRAFLAGVRAGEFDRPN